MRLAHVISLLSILLGLSLVAGCSSEPTADDYSRGFFPGADIPRHPAGEHPFFYKDCTSASGNHYVCDQR